MQWQYTPYLIPMLIAVAISTALSVYAGRHRAATGATTFAWLMLAVTGLALSYAATLANHDPSTKVFLAKMQFVGYVSLPVAWLAFALEYTGRYEWLTRRRLALMALVPSATLLLAWTNETHGLIWNRIKFYQDGGLTLMDITFGSWFWIHALYSYLCLLTGTALIGVAIVRSLHLYRRQAGALLVAVLLPWVGNVLYVFHLGPLPNLDLTPLAFTLTGLTIVWGLLRYQLFDLIPVARSRLVDLMSDGMMVLDAQNRILDMNPAIQATLGVQAKEVIGQPVNRALGRWPEIVERFQNVTPTHSEIRLQQNHTLATYDVRITPLLNRQGQSAGRLILTRDITDPKRRQEEREKLIVELQEALAQVKQLKNLLPICASCKKIRDDEGYWQEVEVYIHRQVDVRFSHGICPDCVNKLYPDYLAHTSTEQERRRKDEPPLSSSPETVSLHAGQSDMAPPPPDELAILYDLARQGNLRGIQARAAQLPQLDPQYQPFADRVRQLAQDFEDKALVALIKHYLDENA